MDSVYKRIIIFGDNYGIPLMLKYLPARLVRAVVAASIRPDYIKEIAKLASSLKASFLIQPRYNTREYALFFKAISKITPDLLICNSYSMIIRRDILKALGYNAINVHSALLPRNRGPNPVQWAIIKGECETGVTIHYMDERIDCGDIIAQKKVMVGFEDTWVALSRRITLAMEELLSEQITLILNAENNRYVQDGSLASYNKRLTANTPMIDFVKMSDTEIYNLIRAQVKPLRGAFVVHKGRRLYFDEFVRRADIKKIRDRYAG